MSNVVLLVIFGVLSIVSALGLWACSLSKEISKLIDSVLANNIVLKDMNDLLKDMNDLLNRNMEEGGESLILKWGDSDVARIAEDYAFDIEDEDALRDYLNMVLDGSSDPDDIEMRENIISDLLTYAKKSGLVEDVLDDIMPRLFDGPDSDIIQQGLSDEESLAFMEGPSKDIKLSYKAYKYAVDRGEAVGPKSNAPKAAGDNPVKRSNRNDRYENKIKSFLNYLESSKLDPSTIHINRNMAEVIYFLVDNKLLLSLTNNNINKISCIIQNPAWIEGDIQHIIDTLKYIITLEDVVSHTFKERMESFFEGIKLEKIEYAFIDKKFDIKGNCYISDGSTFTLELSRDEIAKLEDSIRVMIYSEKYTDPEKLILSLKDSIDKIKD